VKLASSLKMTIIVELKDSRAEKPAGALS